MFEVISLDEAPRWSAAFAGLPEEWRDVHFHPGYYRVHEDGEQRAACALMSDERGVALYPFLRCPISDPALVPAGEKWFDLQGALGYNGMAASTDAPDFLADFHRNFSSYCQATGVVAEISRLNPAIGNERFAAGFMTVTPINQNVIVDLTLSEEDLWHVSYAQAARKQVNKGRRNGLVTRLANSAPDLASFHAIFDHTMERNNAEPSARHPLVYYEALAALCPDGMLFYLTEHEGRAVAAELISHGSTTAYSFLGGTLAEAFPLAANDVLKHDIILDLKRRGLRRYCLGGGHVPGDDLLRYKRKFSVNGVVEFKMASRIHQPEVFQRLNEAWSKAYPERAARGMGKLLPYRF
jgi:hypothetical protein